MNERGAVVPYRFRNNKYPSSALPMGVNFSAYFKFMSCVLITFSFKTRYLMILFFPSENKKNTEKSMHNA